MLGAMQVREGQILRYTVIRLEGHRSRRTKSVLWAQNRSRRTKFFEANRSRRTKSLFSAEFKKIYRRETSSRVLTASFLQKKRNNGFCWGNKRFCEEKSLQRDKVGFLLRTKYFRGHIALERQSPSQTLSFQTDSCVRK